MSEGVSIGSLDDFEDITEKLSDMGVYYVLMVCIPGSTKTHTWSNTKECIQARRNMNVAFNEHIEEIGGCD